MQMGIEFSRAGVRSPGDNTATDVDTLTPLADVLITKTEIGRASCRERGKISVVAVSLKKKSTATNLSVNDALPTGTTSAAWSGTDGSSGTGNLTDTILSLAAGATVTYTYTVQISK